MNVDMLPNVRDTLLYAIAIHVDSKDISDSDFRNAIEAELRKHVDNRPREIKLRGFVSAVNPQDESLDIQCGISQLPATYSVKQRDVVNGIWRLGWHGTLTLGREVTFLCD